MRGTLLAREGAAQRRILCCLCAYVAAALPLLSLSLSLSVSHDDEGSNSGSCGCGNVAAARHPLLLLQQQLPVLPALLSFSFISLLQIVSALPVVALLLRLSHLSSSPRDREQPGQRRG